MIETDGDVAPGTALVVKLVGTRDVQPGAAVTDPVLPSPADFMIEGAGGRPTLASRDWGEAVLAALDVLPAADADDLVRRELDVPMLRRVLEEADLPHRVDLLLVVSDQSDERFRRSDSLHLGTLAHRWVRARSPQAHVGAQVGRVGTVRLAERPQDPDAVLGVLEPLMPRLARGYHEIVVVQGGGTAGMLTAALLAFTTGAGIDVRQVHVQEQGAVEDRSFPALVRLDGVLHVAEELLSSRQPGAAADVLEAYAQERPDLTRAVAYARAAHMLAGRRVVVADIPEGLPGAERDVLLDMAERHWLATATRLAAWEAVAAWEAGDFQTFANLWSALLEWLPATWFLGRGADLADVESVLAIVGTDLDRAAFASCGRASGVNRAVRERLLSGSTEDDVAAGCREIFVCATTHRRCTCGLDRIAGPDLRRAAATWHRASMGGLSSLRNTSILSHGIVPRPGGDFLSALDFDKGRLDMPPGPDVRQLVQKVLMRVGPGFDRDHVGRLCGHARDALTRRSA